MIYNKVYGAGGIGSGIFFELEGNHTLGRDESRLAFLTDYNDYCKCHIILHYVARLTDAEIYAIGKVGNDEQGERLINKMKSVGIRVDKVKKSNTERTMFAVCFQYPDGSGGNITTVNSACDKVDLKYIEDHSSGIDKNTVVLAAPEVPVASRIRLLEIGREKGAFCISSFLSGEAHEFEKSGGFVLSDLVSVNIDEAKAVTGFAGSKADAAKKAIEHIAGLNPKIKIIVTAGRDGSFVFDGKTITQIPIIDVKVISTAGCGDALLGGTIAGIINGKSLVDSVKYGTAVSTIAVQSKDTIAEDVTRERVESYVV